MVSKSYVESRIQGLAVACSYNIAGTSKECDILSYNQGEKEKKYGRRYPQHNIYRASESHLRNDVKFNIRLGGAPAFLYPLLDSYLAGYEKILVIGNDEVGKVVDIFKSYFQGNANNITFVHEGPIDKLSRSNTIKIQYKEFASLGPVTTIEISGDTPYVNTAAFKHDPDHLNFDLNLEINVAEVVGPFFPRKYNWQFTQFNPLIQKRELFNAKEPNKWGWKLTTLYENCDFDRIADGVFGSRKTYGSKIGMIWRLTQFLALNNYNLPSYDKLMNVWNSTNSEEKEGIVTALISPITGTRKQIEVRSEIAQTIVPNALGKNTTVIMKKSDQPGLGMDGDSYEDYIIMQQVHDFNKAIYPHHETIDDIVAYVDGNFENKMTNHWPEIANEKLKQFGINAEYNSDGTINKGILSPEEVAGQANLLMQYNERHRNNNTIKRA